MTATHGTIFAFTGSDHFTINFMVKADVGPAIEATIDEIEKSKKHCLW